MTTYRIYPDGTVLHEDDFLEKDNSLPYYDDYSTEEISDELEMYLLSGE